MEKNEDPTVRNAVVEALIRLEATEAVPRMLQYLTDPTMKDVVYRFLVSLGKEHIALIEQEAQSVDFQTKLILIEIMNHLDNQ